MPFGNRISRLCLLVLVTGAIAAPAASAMPFPPVHETGSVPAQDLRGEGSRPDTAGAALDLRGEGSRPDTAGAALDLRGEGSRPDTAGAALDLRGEGSRPDTAGAALDLRSEAARDSSDFVAQPSDPAPAKAVVTAGTDDGVDGALVGLIIAGTLALGCALAALALARGPRVAH